MQQDLRLQVTDVATGETRLIDPAALGALEPGRARTFAFVDADGRPVAVPGLALEQLDDELVIEIEDEEVARVDDFFAPDSESSFEVVETGADGAQTVVAIAAGDAVTDAESDVAQPVWPREDDGAGLAQAAIGAGAVVGAAALVGVMASSGGDDDDFTAPVPVNAANETPEPSVPAAATPEPTEPDVVAEAGNVIEMTLVAGPFTSFNGVSANVFSDAGTLLGSAKVGAGGKVSVDVGTYTGAVVVKTADLNDGGDYLDEATGAVKDLAGDLYAPGVVAAGGATTKLNVTPLSTVSTLKMLGLTEAPADLAKTLSEIEPSPELVTLANDVIAKTFGLKSLHYTEIVTVNGETVFSEADGIDESERYGQILSTLSGVDKLNGGDLQTTLKELAEGISIKVEGGKVDVAVSPELMAKLDAGTAAANAETGVKDAAPAVPGGGILVDGIPVDEILIGGQADQLDLSFFGGNTDGEISVEPEAPEIPAAVEIAAEEAAAAEAAAAEEARAAAEEATVAEAAAAEEARVAAEEAAAVEAVAAEEARIAAEEARIAAEETAAAEAAAEEARIAAEEAATAEAAEEARIAAEEAAAAEVAAAAEPEVEEFRRDDGTLERVEITTLAEDSVTIESVRYEYYDKFGETLTSYTTETFEDGALSDRTSEFYLDDGGRQFFSETFAADGDTTSGLSEFFRPDGTMSYRQTDTYSEGGTLETSIAEYFAQDGVTVELRDVTGPDGEPVDEIDPIDETDPIEEVEPIDEAEPIVEVVEFRRDDGTLERVETTTFAEDGTTPLSVRKDNYTGFYDALGEPVPEYTIETYAEDGSLVETVEGNVSSETLRNDGTTSVSDFKIETFAGDGTLKSLVREYFSDDDGIKDRVSSTVFLEEGGRQTSTQIFSADGVPTSSASTSYRPDETLAERVTDTYAEDGTLETSTVEVFAEDGTTLESTTVFGPDGQPIEDDGSESMQNAVGDMGAFDPSMELASAFLPMNDFVVATHDYY